jgi:PBP1b-binding outer membrane lipoprotein LpoB
LIALAGSPLDLRGLVFAAVLPSDRGRRLQVTWVCGGAADGMPCCVSGRSGGGALALAAESRSRETRRKETTMESSGWRKAAGCVGAALALSGCTTYTTRVDNVPPSRATRYAPVDTPTAQGTTGIESQDIVSMTDQMVRDMLASPVLVSLTEPAGVIVDDQYFVNNSSQRLEKKLIVDRLRTELFRAAKGRMRFIARHASDMFEHEQDLRDQGVVGGTARREADHGSRFFRLTGRFQNLADTIGEGARSNYVQVVFEMIDMSTKELVWTNMYEFKKTSQEGLFYR